MPHPRAEVFWQIPTTGTYKITDARQTPGGEGMGTFGIDWAIKCYQLPIRLPVYSFRLSFRNCTSCVFLFFYLGVGQGGKNYSLKSKAAVFYGAFTRVRIFLRLHVFFYANRPFVHTKPVNPLTETRNLSPKRETRIISKPLFRVS